MLWSFACDLECALTGLGEVRIIISSGTPSFSFFVLHKGWDQKKIRWKHWSSEQGQPFFFLLPICYYSAAFLRPDPPFLFPFRDSLDVIPLTFS